MNAGSFKYTLGGGVYGAGCHDSTSNVHAASFKFLFHV